jgi:hypothetical protein
MKVICIDASNKPAKIALCEWIQEGVVYTVLDAIKMGLQPNSIGLKLQEVELTSKSFPYEYYDSLRFLPIEGIIEESQKIEEELELNLI